MKTSAKYLGLAVEPEAR